MNKTNKYIKLTFLILLLLMLVSGCGQAFQAFQDLSSLRNKIIEKYHENNVGLLIHNGNAISVSFTNSSFNKLEPAQKKEKAKEIALYVKENYAPMDNIDKIIVSFVIHKTYFFVIDYTDGLDTFFYNTDELISSTP